MEEQHDAQFDSRAWTHHFQYEVRVDIFAHERAVDFATGDETKDNFEHELSVCVGRVECLLLIFGWLDMNGIRRLKDIQRNHLDKGSNH